MAFPASSSAFAAMSDRLAPVLLDAAVRSALVLAFTGAAALGLRRASAAARHGVWLLALVAGLLLPMLSATLPAWRILPRLGLLSRVERSAVTVAAPTPSTSTPLVSTAAPAPLNPMGGAETTVRATNAVTSSQAPDTVAMPTTPSPPRPLVRASPTVARVAESGSPQTVRSAAVPWTAWLLCCWLLGSLVVLCAVLLGHLSLWSLQRRCTRVTHGELFDLLERLRDQAGVRRPVELLTSPTRTMPMTWGLLWRARLLVPAQAADWPAGQRRDVLLHELGHVSRRDCFTQLLAQLACAAYWFNPLAWLAARRMQVERERACDDLVLSSGAEASAYATHLLQSVASVPALRLVGAAAVAMARLSTLEERMRAILNARLNRRAPTVRGSVATILLLLATLVPVAMLRAQERPPPGASRRPGDDALPPPRARPRSVESPPTRPSTAGPRFSTRAGFGAPGGGAAAAPTLGEGPTCTLDATIYDVRMPADTIGRLDVEALTKASTTAEGFEKALAALGTTKPLYRASQSVRLSSDNITIGSEMPFVTSSRMSDKGQAINTVQYMSTGAIFTLAGKAPAAAGAMELDLKIELSSASEGGAEIADKVKAPVMRRAIISHKGPVQPHNPFVVVSVDAGAVDGEGKAVAYIGRITMGEPQAPSAR